MKKLILFFVALATSVFAQTLQIEENFDYGSTNDTSLITLTTSWSRHSGLMGPAYDANGLTYSGYASSGIGGKLSFTNGTSGNNDGDINRKFDSVTTTSNIYISFLVNLTSAKSAEDYFFHIGPKTISTTFRGRVFARSNGSGWSISLSKSTTTNVDDSTVLNFNQTYLFVLKYSFSTLSNNDDLVTLYVYESGVPSSEPDSPLVTIGPLGDTGTDPGNIGTIAIRQGNNTPTGYIDGIRVADSWLQAPLPVELTSFTSNILSNGVELKWQTATEVNNYGFEILRSVQNDNINDNWTTLGFVNGNGNSNSPKDYSFVDEDIKNQPNGKYYYRLKQIDTDGSYEYSEEIEVNWTNGITDVNDDNNNLPKEYSLSQNYPNPFNPSTKIKYAIPSFVETHSNVFQQNGISVKLKIYNVMGQEIATLVNEIKTPGEYEVEFNGKGLSSGMYFYKIEAGNFVQVKKMIMMK